MSTIPDGLRADLMRARMEDKATITSIGGLYVGGTTPVTYTDNEGASINGYATECLVPGVAGLPLVSNGAGQKPSYQLLGSNGIANGAITPSILGAGTIVASDSSHKYSLSMSASGLVLNIQFTQIL